MFRIKICGVRSVADALMVAASGADALGLNFYANSRRAVDEATAREIAAALPKEIVKVGVFVNEEAETICWLCDSVPLDLIQLHGDEEPEFLARLEGRPIVRAFRLGESGLAPVRQYLGECDRLGCPPELVMLDAHSAGAYGGTGTVANWNVAAGYHSGDSMQPLVMAGGLTPENVAEAIRQVRPAAVDTASGVESAGGGKDRDLVAAFVGAARRAFQELAESA